MTCLKWLSCFFSNQSNIRWPKGNFDYLINDCITGIYTGVDKAIKCIYSIVTNDEDTICKGTMFVLCNYYYYTCTNSQDVGCWVPYYAVVCNSANHQCVGLAHLFHILESHKPSKCLLPHS